MACYLITGAAHGLGHALTLHLAQKDHQLILVDKDLKALNALYDALDEKGNCEPALFPIDLKGAQPVHYLELRQAIEENYGHLDAVFLNAATHPAFTPIEHFDPQQWYDVIQTNLHANFYLIQNLLPLLKASDHAKLIAVLDENIETHPAYYGAYGAAKAGMQQLMTTLAHEHRETSMDFYTARLTAFQSDMRARLFPAENPNTLPTAEAMAKHLALIVLEGLQAEFITRL